MSDQLLSDEQIRKYVRTSISNKVRKGELNVPMLPHVAQKVLEYGY